MELKEAVEIIKSNWPDEWYTMLREALTVVLEHLQTTDNKELIINRLQHLAIEQGLDMDNCKDIAEVYEKHFKSEIEQLYACRANLRDCLEQMERTPKSAVSPDFIAAIDDGRKALEEE